MLTSRVYEAALEQARAEIAARDATIAGLMEAQFSGGGARGQVTAWTDADLAVQWDACFDGVDSTYERVIEVLDTHGGSAYAAARDAIVAGAFVALWRAAVAAADALLVDHVFSAADVALGLPRDGSEDTSARLAALAHTAPMFHTAAALGSLAWPSAFRGARVRATVLADAWLHALVKRAGLGEAELDTLRRRGARRVVDMLEAAMLLRVHALLQRKPAVLVAPPLIDASERVAAAATSHAFHVRVEGNPRDLRAAPIVLVTPVLALEAPLTSLDGLQDDVEAGEGAVSRVGAEGRAAAVLERVVAADFSRKLHGQPLAGGSIAAAAAEATAFTKALRKGATLAAMSSTSEAFRVARRTTDWQVGLDAAYGTAMVAHAAAVHAADADAPVRAPARAVPAVPLSRDDLRAMTARDMDPALSLAGVPLTRMPTPAVTPVGLPRVTSVALPPARIVLPSRVSRAAWEPALRVFQELINGDNHGMFVTLERPPTITVEGADAFRGAFLGSVPGAHVDEEVADAFRTALVGRPLRVRLSVLLDMPSLRARVLSVLATLAAALDMDAQAHRNPAVMEEVVRLTLESPSPPSRADAPVLEAGAARARRGRRSAV